MLDGDPCRLTKTGTVVVTDGKIEIGGFSSDDGTCRDTAALALVWAIGRLQAADGQAGASGRREYRHR